MSTKSIFQHVLQESIHNEFWPEDGFLEANNVRKYKQTRYWIAVEDGVKKQHLKYAVDSNIA